MVLLAALLLSLALSFATSSQEAKGDNVAGYDYSNDQASHYIAERSTHVALLPEVNYTLAPSTSRTLHHVRHRSIGSSVAGCTPAIRESAHHITIHCPSGEVVARLHASRAVDYYIYALRHIII